MSVRRPYFDYFIDPAITGHRMYKCNLIKFQGSCTYTNHAGETWQKLKVKFLRSYKLPKREFKIRANPRESKLF